jgi:outer membrane protein TolC
MLAALGSGEHGATTMPDDPMRWGLTVGAMISIPIAPWSRSGPEALAEARRLDADEQQYRREIMRRDMIASLESSLAQARRAQRRLDFHVRTQIPMLEKSLRVAQADYENGRASFASVIDIYSILIMARMDAYMQEMERAMALSMVTEMTGVTR